MHPFAQFIIWTHKKEVRKTGQQVRLIQLCCYGESKVLLAGKIKSIKEQAVYNLVSSILLLEVFKKVQAHPTE